MFSKKAKLSAILALFVGLLFTANIANAQTQQASESTALEGKVIDSQAQQPVSGIELTLKGTNKTAQTNQKGKFSFAGLEPGTYTLTATPEGYQKVSKEVVLTSSGVKLGPTEDTFTIKLKTSQSSSATSY